MRTRYKHDLILVSIIPHLFSLYFTTGDIVYSSIILTSSSFSFIWHKNHEPRNILLYCDYTFATILTFYEILNMYYNNYNFFYLSIYLNMLVLLFNKMVYILSIYRYINYNKWHSAYHIFSSAKTIFISYISGK